MRSFCKQYYIIFIGRILLHFPFSSVYLILSTLTAGAKALAVAQAPADKIKIFAQDGFVVYNSALRAA
jgi:hypothetical protein